MFTMELSLATLAGEYHEEEKDNDDDDHEYGGYDDDDVDDTHNHKMMNSPAASHYRAVSCYSHQGFLPMYNVVIMIIFTIKSLYQLHVS